MARNNQEPEPETEAQTAAKRRRAPVMQTDVPSMSLDQALRVPRAIAEQYASKPTTPLNVAAALEMTPTSGPFKALCGAAIAYGLTEGGYNAQQISITPLGKRIVRPLQEGDELVARREAVLKPRVVGDFLRRYGGSSLPKDAIAVNVLEEMGVPRERAAEAFALVTENSAAVGLLKTIKDKRYVDLSGSSPAGQPSVGTEGSDDENPPPGELASDVGVDAALAPPHPAPSRAGLDRTKRRVFLTHGKNTSFLDPIKKLLAFGELEPVVSAEKQTVSKPVPEKVLTDMRTCGAAIIHVDAERVLVDREANEHIVLNENVLIEIGAAMALYGRRFILLVKEGIRLPSNLQGLYEVRYQGDALDGVATIRLLEAINDIKNHALPNET